VVFGHDGGIGLVIGLAFGFEAVCQWMWDLVLWMGCCVFCQIRI
jgi:hypothetical protein